MRWFKKKESKFFETWHKKARRLGEASIDASEAYYAAYENALAIRNADQYQPKAILMNQSIAADAFRAWQEAYARYESHMLTGSPRQVTKVIERLQAAREAMFNQSE